MNDKDLMAINSIQSIGLARLTAERNALRAENEALKETCRSAFYSIENVFAPFGSADPRYMELKPTVNKLLIASNRKAKRLK